MMTIQEPSSVRNEPLAAGRRQPGKTGLTLGAALIVIASWLLIVFDGYDLIVFGVVKSSLLAEPWGLTEASAGTLGSLAFLGMMVGALVAGRLSDSLGRVGTIVVCTLVFTVATVACGMVDNGPAFGVLRLLAGLGLGGVMPAANALAGELVPTRWRGAMATLMMSGVPIGGITASLTGLAIVPNAGWRWMFALPALAVIVVLPLFLYGARQLRRERGPEAALVDAQEHASDVGYKALFKGEYRWVTVLFVLTTLAILFVWYGLGTELPHLMVLSGFDIGSSLTFSLALNIGAVLGSLFTAFASVRFGAVRAAVVSATIAAVGLVLLLTNPSTFALYACVIAAGIGTHGTQCLVIGAVSAAYPDRMRGTALGLDLGVGRLGAVLAPQTAGLLLGAGLGAGAVFVAFAIGALIVTVMLLILNGRLRRLNSTRSVTDQA